MVLSYEYRGYFKRLHIEESRKVGADLNENLKIQNELDEVYAQAALKKEKIKQIEEAYKVRYSEHIELKRKADEYEVKAKAFDEIIKEYDEITKEVRNRRFKHVTLLGIKVEKMIKKYKRGELE